MSGVQVFRVIDCATGEEASLREIEEALTGSGSRDHWAHGLIYCDLDCWVLDPDGGIALCDDTGAMRYPEAGMYSVEFPALAAKDAEIERMQEEVRLLRGAMRADDERLRAAELRANGDPTLTMGCDALDWFADKILGQRAEIERLGGVLKRIAKDGCGCYGSQSGETCRSEHPGNESEWCWCCVAAEAIAPRADGGEG